MKQKSKAYDDEENIVLTIKKSDIKKFFNGNCNFNIKVKKSVISQSQKDNSPQTNPITDENNLNLTSRELQVLERIAKGKTNSQIAKELVVSPHTIKAHVANILQKFKVQDRLQAVVKAIAEKIIDI